MEPLVHLAERIFTESGILALSVIVLLVILGGLVYTMYLLVRQRNADGTAVIAQATAIGNFVTSLKEIADANLAVSKNLVQVAQLLGAHDTGVRELLDNAVGTMQASVDARTEQIEELPQRVKKEMAPELEKLPKAIEDALAPKIVELKVNLEKLIAEFANDLTQRIDTAADEIPSRTTAMVRGELATLLETAMQDMLETAKKITAEDDAPPEETLRPQES